MTEDRLLTLIRQAQSIIRRLEEATRTDDDTTSTDSRRSKEVPADETKST